MLGARAGGQTSEVARRARYSHAPASGKAGLARVAELGDERTRLCVGHVENTRETLQM